MKFVSLFAGIGGLDVGLERAGHTCIGQVEIDDYATKVLEKHWPDVPRIRDVRDFHGHEFGHFDMLVGGYPCQPFSIAGSRKGEHDERHLWPEVLRILRNVRPKYLFVENVTGHLSLGFGRVLGDLAESGYDAEWDCIPAAAVGANHRRDRVFIIGHNRDVAHTKGEYGNGFNDHAGSGVASGSTTEFGDGGGSPHVANTDYDGFIAAEERQSIIQGSHTSQTEQGITSKPAGRGRESRQVDANTKKNMANAYESQRERGRISERTQSQHANTSGTSWWAVEPNVGRVAHGIPARVDRLRGLGNAVVPQVAEWIGLRLPL